MQNLLFIQELKNYLPDVLVLLGDFVPIVGLEEGPLVLLIFMLSALNPLHVSLKELLLIFHSLWGIGRVVYPARKLKEGDIFLM